MLKMQQDVYEFMFKAKQQTPWTPGIPNTDVLALRKTLHNEEAVVEFSQHCDSGNFEEIIDTIVDSLVVVMGSAVACGIDIEPFWNIVHEANMAKFGPGGFRREDGKWMKPPDWKFPYEKFREELNRQIKKGIQYA